MRKKVSLTYSTKPTKDGNMLIDGKCPSGMDKNDVEKRIRGEYGGRWVSWKQMGTFVKFRYIAFPGGAR